MPPRSITRLLPWLTLLVGLLLTALAWQAARQREQRVVATRFQAESEQVARSVAWEVSLFTDVLSSLGPLHALSDRVSATDFEEFARKGMAHQQAVLGAFGFAQSIPGALRVAFEEPGPDGQLARRLSEFDDAQNLRPAGPRENYFPLTYQNPPQGLGLPDGFDLGSLPGAEAALDRMSRDRRPVLGPRTDQKVAGASEEEISGYLVFSPIFQDDQSLSGFTTAILWPQDLLQRALSRTLARGVQITLFDPAQGQPPLSRADGLAREQIVSLVDTAWRLRCESLPSYFEAHASPLPWLALGAGLLVTLLLVRQTAVLVERAARIEATVRERTAELQSANARLAEEMKERARLEVEIEETAEREKRRLGHDLHDSLGQKLTGAVYLSKALAGSLEPAAGEARAAAEKINDILKDAVAEVRRTARGLAPVEVGEGGLAQALHRLAEDTCSVYGIACSFRAEGAPDPGDARKATQLYHIAQEAVTNAVRHGGAREIAITLGPGELVIRDHGRGWDLTAPAGAGAGLRIMRHRAASIGARLEITSRPGDGATVSCRL